MNILLHPTYFPSIATFVALAKAKQITFEAEDNFQKQTYRNRAYIFGANGKLALNIPVTHTQKERQKYRDVRIANDEKWQDHHWKSIQSAYSTSPFFEYYEDEIKPLFKEKKTSLFDLNIECIKSMVECIELDLNTQETSNFIKDYNEGDDLRHLVNAKQEPDFHFKSYIQVFSEKHGFIPNLSILDLLFNEGPNTLNYLQSQSL